MAELVEKSINFLSLPPDAWPEYLTSLGYESFRGEQVRRWIFENHTFHPSEMANLPKKLREQLLASLDWSLPSIHHRVESEDGSTKLILRTSTDRAMETVIMRYEGRTSLCVSSQVGCKLACDFCQTGKMGFMSHLSQAAILGQFAVALEVLKSEPKTHRLSHVVFMGMGEPLDNYKETVGAAKVLLSPLGFSLSKKNVTISTSGLAPQIIQLAHDCDAAFALSLHACRDDLRNQLMPINRKYPLADLKNSLLTYQKLTGRLITIEYILIKGVNCGMREVKELVKFVHGLKVKVNLIPFNPHPGMSYERPDEDTIRAFQSYLSQRSIPAPVRYSKGLDVSAACGQLAAKQLEELHQGPERKRLLLQTT